MLFWRYSLLTGVPTPKVGEDNSKYDVNEKFDVYFGKSRFVKVKVTGYVFRGSNSVILVFASLLKRGQLLKERICSHEQILSCKG